MELLPIEIEELIYDYKSQMEMTEKYNKSVEYIKKNLIYKTHINYNKKVETTMIDVTKNIIYLYYNCNDSLYIHKYEYTRHTELEYLIVISKSKISENNSGKIYIDRLGNIQ